MRACPCLQCQERAEGTAMMKNICLSAIAVLVSAAGATAASTGTLTLNNGGKSVACTTGFYSGMTCYSATIEGCVDYLDHTLVADDLTFGITSKPSKAKGVIVLHDGDGGTNPYSWPNGLNYFASDYFAAGYQVVQVAWTDSWQTTGLSQEFDVKAGACRPATFFEYIRTTYYLPMHTGVGGPGFCVQGASAGAGVIGYYLAEYGGGGDVDKAVLHAGPQYADVEKGCEVPNAKAVTGCPSGGVWPCAKGVSKWTYGPQFANTEVYSFV